MLVLGVNTTIGTNELISSIDAGGNADARCEYSLSKYLILTSNLDDWHVRAWESLTFTFWISVHYQAPPRVLGKLTRKISEQKR